MRRNRSDGFSKGKLVIAIFIVVFTIIFTFFSISFISTFYQTEDCSKGKAKGDVISAKMIYDPAVTKLFPNQLSKLNLSEERQRIGERASF